MIVKHKDVTKRKDGILIEEQNYFHSHKKGPQQNKDESIKRIFYS